MAQHSRRDFIGWALSGISAVGGVLALGAMKKSWDPLPSVQSAGFVSVDLSGMKEGEMHTVQWRGKPVFILHKSAETPSNDKRDIRIGEKRFVVLIGLCTHLGCIPSYEASSQTFKCACHGGVFDASGIQTFKCACHGGVFDASGIQTFGPPPRPLDIPPFKLSGETIVLGEEGAEYQKMTKKA